MDLSEEKSLALTSPALAARATVHHSGVRYFKVFYGHVSAVGPNPKVPLINDSVTYNTVVSTR